MEVAMLVLNISTSRNRTIDHGHSEHKHRQNSQHRDPLQIVLVEFGRVTSFLKRCLIGASSRLSPLSVSEITSSPIWVTTVEPSSPGRTLKSNLALVKSLTLSHLVKLRQHKNVETTIISRHRHMCFFSFQVTGLQSVSNHERAGYR